MRPSTRWAWIVVLATAFAFHAPEAHAHMIWRAKPVKKMTPRQERAYGIYSMRHGKAEARVARQTLRWFRQNRRKTIRSSDPATRRKARSEYRQELIRFRNHRWLYHHGKARKANAHARMRPAVPALSNDWLTRAFLCIHRYEGSWTDPNPPYWGGLQMDWNFMSAYGGKYLRRLGTADRWPPATQIAVAKVAYYSGRGFGPWPNTRRMCGL